MEVPDVIQLRSGQQLQDIQHSGLHQPTLSGRYVRRVEYTQEIC